ncbi:MAG: hypothetical protein LBP59_07335 [Planctomycetaceae bacterium]|jgi:hypothetical protein|nr:hypothetical protein [Planctomycetaceae bacterium]
MSRGQNDLKDFIVNQYEDWIYPNRKVLGSLVFVVIAILGVLFFVSRSNANIKATAWEQFFRAIESPDPVKPLEEFAKIKDGFFEYQAAITAGQLLLAQACNAGLTDKSQVTTDLNKALDLFQNVRNSRKAPQKFKRQAAFGIAQVYEAKAGVSAGSNDLETAIAEYKKIVEIWQGEYEAKIAEKQLELITRPNIKKFYDRYATANVETTPNPADFKIEIDPNAPLVPNSSLDELLKNITTEPQEQKNEDKQKNDSDKTTEQIPNDKPKTETKTETEPKTEPKTEPNKKPE